VLEVALVNLLQRRGYRDLEAARGSAREEGREEGQELSRAAARTALRELCAARGWALSEAQTSVLEARRDLPALFRLIADVAQARTAEELFRPLARA
jgi:DNA invertase Pin-like site-specific DNA recombinase